jgi:hypothetical protein
VAHGSKVRWLTLASLACLTAGMAGGTAGPLAAVDAADPAFASFAGDLSDLVPAGQRPALAGATEADGPRDLYHPSGEEPGIASPYADIGLVASFDVEMTEALAEEAAGPGGILNCDTDGTICSAMRAGEPASTSFRAHAGEMQGPLGPRTGVRQEYGVVAFDASPRDGRPAAAWEAIPEFRGDFFHGSNVAWTLLSENGAPFRLMRLEYGPGDAGFLATNTDAVAIVRGATWTILVPAAEWEGVDNSRLYAFRAEGDNFEPTTSAVDTYPDIFDPPSAWPTRATIAIDSATARGGVPGWLLPAVLAIVGLALLIVGGWIDRRRGPRWRVGGR